MYVYVCVYVSRTSAALEPSSAEKEKELMERLRELLWDRQTAPLVGLASGLGSLADKFHSCCQTSFLVGGGRDSSSHASALSSFCREISACVGDMGVEFSIPTVCPLPAEKIFPWLPLPEPEAPTSELDDWFFNPMAAPSHLVSFSHALQIPGLQHVVHNAATDMLDACPKMKPEVTKLMAVVKMCIRKFSRKRLLGLCYDSELGKVMARQLKFHTEVHSKRWRTLATGVADVMLAKAALQWGWDRDRYVDREKKVASYIEVVDSAINNNRFWFCMEALDSLYYVVDELCGWARDCPCHGGLITPDTPPHVKRRWLACPCRGLRLAELCSGALLAHACDVLKLQAVTLAVGAPDGLDVHDRDAVIFEYHRAQTHLLSTLALKLGPLQYGQYNLAGAAHHDHHIARSFLQKCLNSSCTHPLMQELMASPLREEAEEFINGWRDWQELRALPSFIGQFRFCPVDETVVEGIHAMIERRVGNVTNRTMAYDSVTARMPWMWALAKFPDLQQTLAGMLAEINSPLKLATFLGFGNHPSAPLSLRRAWSTQWREMIYREDEFTLFSANNDDIVVGCSGLETVRTFFDNVPRNSQSVYAELERLALVEHILDCFGQEQPKDAEEHDDEAQEDQVPQPNKLLSCRVSRDGLQSIHDLCGPSSGQSQASSIPWLDESAEGRFALSHSVLGDWAERQRRGGHLFMSVVNKDISSLKRPFENSSKLQKSDVVVNVHRVLEVENPSILVDSSAINITAIEAGIGYVPSTSLALSLSALDTEALNSIRMFDVKGQLQSRIDVTKLKNAAPASCNEAVAKCVSAYLAFGEPIDPAHRASALVLLECLRAEGFVQHAQGRERFMCAGDTSGVVCTGWWISEGKRLARIREQLPLLELSRWELMQKLELDGWQFKSVHKKKRLPVPYVTGNPKFWCVVFNKTFKEKGHVMYACLYVCM